MTKTASKKKASKKKAKPEEKGFPDTPWGQKQRERAEQATTPDPE